MLSKFVSRQNIRTYIIAALFVAAIIFMVTKNILDVMFKRSDIIYWKPITPNITCYYYDDGDALPSAEGASFAPAPRSIFFHETSCRGGLNSRQACAVESAARANPHRQVHLLFTAPVTQHVLNNSCISKLLELDNVKLARVHVTKYTKDTPLGTIFSKALKLSKYPVEHAADVLRIVTLNKWGGVYMDLDMIVVRSLDSLPLNWVVKQTKDEIATGIMAFDTDEIGRKFTNEIIRNISKTFDPTAWTFNGPDAFARLVNEECPGFFNSSDNVCNGLLVYPSTLFYPIKYPSGRLYYEAQYLALLYEDIKKIKLIHKPYTYHMWNYNGKYIDIEKDSLYARLAKKYCPTIHGAYGDKFGV